MNLSRSAQHDAVSLVHSLARDDAPRCRTAGAQGVLIDKSEIRFISRQMGVNVEGRFRYVGKPTSCSCPKDLGRIES